VLNSNAGDRSARAPLAAALARARAFVLLFDYRGYGGNPGSPSETGLAADARAARDYLDSRPDVRSGSVVYYGESLGAAVAIGLAVERPPAALVRASLAVHEPRRRRPAALSLPAGQATAQGSVPLGRPDRRRTVPHRRTAVAGLKTRSRAPAFRFVVPVVVRTGATERL
jgi:fermentation-respiration switch protein FrsA (DUF1100 family)